MSTFLLLILGAFLRHQYLAQVLFVTTHGVDGFGFCFHHPSKSKGATATPSFGAGTRPSARARATGSNDYAQRYMTADTDAATTAATTTTATTLPSTNSSRNDNDKDDKIADSIEMFLDDIDDYDDYDDDYDEITATITATSYPWSKVQEWALRDNLPKYTVRIPTKIKTRTKTSGKKAEMTLKSYALWRNLREDVPELCGYPIEFLRSRQEKMYNDQQQQQQQQQQQRAADGDGDGDGDENNTSSKTTTTTTTTATTLGVLPFLQDYEFSAKGGIGGYVYGLTGLSDGSRIQTSEVKNVEETLPRGYIQTSDGTSFELGRPLETASSSDAGVGGKQNQNQKATAKSISVSDAVVANLAAIDPTAANIDLRTAAAAVVEDADGMLLRLGATTGILLAGATAFNMLSHHLTVNVFWV
eukprot:jgi/Psemu1/68931/estExt_Genemark1.C_6380025